jgi:hypothetical protein
LDYRYDLFAVLIAEGELRAEQVGSAHVAAAEVGAVAAAAGDAIDAVAAGDFGRVAWRSLLSGDEATHSAGRWRLCGQKCGCGEDERECSTPF